MTSVVDYDALGQSRSVFKYQKKKKKHVTYVNGIHAQAPKVCWRDKGVLE